jgi:uncharacterized membrane protein
VRGEVESGVVSESAAARRQIVNVGPGERVLSTMGGGLLLAWALIRAPVGVVAAALGASLAYRGFTGFCPVYHRLGVDRSIRGNVGIKIDRAVTVGESPEVLFRFWRDFGNLSEVIPNLESVTAVGSTRSHWVMKAPAGMAVEWDAEIINEIPNRLIAWRSVPTSAIQHAGSVRFVPVGSATRVEVSLQYAPPAGELGHVLAELLGADAGSQVEQGLWNFKTSMERGRMAERSNR